MPKWVYELGPTAQMKKLNDAIAAQELLAMIPDDVPEEAGY